MCTECACMYVCKHVCICDICMDIVQLSPIQKFMHGFVGVYEDEKWLVRTLSVCTCVCMHVLRVLVANVCNCMRLYLCIYVCIHL